MRSPRACGVCRCRRPLVQGLALLFFCGLAGPASGAGAGQAEIADKRLGEEDRILARRDWFYSTRRAGTSSEQELRGLRLTAVQETRQALAAQRARWALGAEPGQNVWVAMGPSPSNFGGWAFGTISGRIQALAADWSTGALYAGAASGGVWKSTNDGLSWSSLFDSAGTLAVGAIEVDPNDPNVLWVGTGDNIFDCEGYFGIGLLRSGDGGATWELRNGSGAATLEDLSSFAGITVDPRDSQRIVAGGRNRGCSSGTSQPGGIYSSDDGGATWVKRLANTEIHEIARNPDLPDILWAATRKGVFRSLDNGTTWVAQNATGLPHGNLGRTEIAIAPSDPSTVYALFDVPGDQFWRTTNGGGSWSLMSSGACDGQCWYNMVIRVDALNPNIVYRGTIRIFRSLNGGSTWTPITNTWGTSQQVHQDTQSMLIRPTFPGRFYVGTDGGLWKTENGGSSFSNINGNLNVTQFYGIGVDANDPGRICGGAQDNSSLARDDSDVWDLQGATGDGFLCHMNPINTNYAYVSSYPSGGFPNVWRSTTGPFGSYSGITGPGSGIIGGDRISWVTPYVLDPTSPSTLYLGTHRVYRSNNHGSSWVQVGPPDLSGDGSSSLSVVEVNRAFPSHLFSGSYGGAVWRSANGGTNWTDISAGLPQRAVNDVAGDPTNPDRAFAVVGGFNVPHVWEWSAGAGWTSRDSGLPNVPANTVLMLSATDLLVGTDTGIFRSGDGGLSFVPFMVGFPEGLVVTDLQYNPLQEVVTAGTYGRGAWQMDIGTLFQPILLPDSVVQPLVEVDGDADGAIEPGETWSVRPILHNAGGVTATDVTARLATTTPGAEVLAPDVGSFGDLATGASAPSSSALLFTVDPTFDCGSQIVFDLVDIASATPPGVYADRPGAYAAPVQGGNEPPLVTSLLHEDFDPAPPEGWPHELVKPAIAGCALTVYRDEWTLTSKDAAHGTSYHCGNGPGASYGATNAAWLHPVGKDSTGGVGLEIPATATAATLTLVHWYDTAAGQDGGKVVVDVVADGQNSYATLKPVGDYPGVLAGGFCNPLEGQKAFQGSSGGWITSLFDLTPYKGQRIFLALVFGSDSQAAAGEGWYIDELRVEFQMMGAPTCDSAPWPGTVPSAHFDRISADVIQASWDPSCNAGDFPQQTYSIQAGDLDTLVNEGIYTHAPLDGLCDRAPSSSFTPGPDNEYYLIVPVGEGREGGAGSDSTGAARPQPGVVCGERRVACP